MKLLVRKALPRRTLLRGSVAGTAVSIALPFLEAMRPRRASAQAAAPRRFVAAFIPDGFSVFRGSNDPNAGFGGTRPGGATWYWMDTWTPQNTGPGWVANRASQPYVDAGVRSDVTLLSGLSSRFTGGVHEATACMLVPFGMIWGEKVNVRGGGISLDQALAARVGAGTAYRSLHFGVIADSNQYNVEYPVMHAAARQPVLSENDPIKMFDRVFAGLPAGGGSPSGPDPTLERLRRERKSVLDGVGAYFGILQKRVGGEDRARLDRHASTIRDLERRLVTDFVPPPSPSGAATCARPAAPTVPYRDETKLPELVKAQSDLMIMALKCDLTRVATFNFLGAEPRARYRHLGHTRGRHDITHDWNAWSLALEGDVYNNRVVAELVAALKATPDGDGTLLDTTAFLAATEIFGGMPHTAHGWNWRGMAGNGADTAFVVAGMTSAWKHGSHLRFKPSTGSHEQLLRACYEVVTGLSGNDSRAWMSGDFSSAPLPGLQGDAYSGLHDFPAPYTA